MISYEVIVKPEYTYTAPPFTGTSTQRAYPDIKNQADLDKFWAEGPFSRGDFVTYTPSHMLNKNCLASVYQILELQTDFTQMTVRNYIPYHPVLIKISSVNSTATGNWERWDDLRNLRKLTEAEYENVVRPHLDRVRGNS